MPLLDQQELLEAPPSRRLIVPKGARAFYGVDPGVKRVALSYAIPAPQRPVYAARTASFATLEGGARLEAIWTDTRRFVHDLLTRDGWPVPGIVFVEQPSGKQPNPALSYATGVIIGAVFAGVQDATGHRVRVETVSSSSWKKTATGFGGWRKTVKPYGVLTWAKVNGYPGTSYDEADAMGIAEAARRSVALEER